MRNRGSYLKFVFITGVTKFSKVSIFSDLNQLRDISLSSDYSQICGITEEEIMKNFSPEIHTMAKARGIEDDECLSKLKKMYDGYHFHQDAQGGYNPYSLLNALAEKEFGMYWFSTGTPTFLIEKLKESGFDAKQFSTEVRYGFLKSLAPYYLCAEKTSRPLDVRSFVKDIRKAATDSLRDRFTALFARLPYPTDEKIVEQNFQNVVYIVFMLLGQFTMTEVHSAKGRADCIVETDDYVYIFEFKRDSSADEALKQIEDTGYALAYAADNRKLIKIGANFDSKERTLDGWKVVAE